VTIQNTKRREWTITSGVVLLAVLANIPPQILAALGIDRTVLLVALGIILTLLLTQYSRAMFVCAISTLVAGANLPDQMAGQLQLNTSVMVVALIMIVLLALANHFLSVIPMENTPISKTHHGLRMLEKAIKTGRTSMIRALIDAGVDLNTLTPSGELALNRAVVAGRFDIVELLVQFGANVNGAEGSQRPLAVAHEHRQGQIARYLVANGAL